MTNKNLNKDQAGCNIVAILTSLFSASMIQHPGVHDIIDHFEHLPLLSVFL
jgi:hypothetical protein